jgi:hypothetical protein
MKKNLKKYNDFINEELTAPPKLSDSYLKSNLDRNNAEIFLILRSNFYDGIVNITDDLRPRSFSDMCKKDSNPEEDYKELQSLMDKKGWDIQSIKNLFSNKVDKLCGYGIAKFVRGERTEDFQEVFIELKKQGVSKEKLDDIDDLVKYVPNHRLRIVSKDPLISESDWDYLNQNLYWIKIETINNQ